MQTIEYKTKDKSSWGNGPWQNEPDKKQWLDLSTGLPCLIVRVHGTWCGYVGVSAGHPCYGKSYDDVSAIRVHGGVTFTGTCQPGPESHAICHQVDLGEDDAVFWIGFDCNHMLDLDPEYMARTKHGPLTDRDTYRDLAYVTAEVESLAKQLVDITPDTM